jgi:hypothetical protein
MVEKSGVEKFLLALELNNPGLKLGVEKSGVEISYNPQKVRHCRAVLSVTYLTPITIALETKINRDHHYHH